MSDNPVTVIKAGRALCGANIAAQENVAILVESGKIRTIEPFLPEKFDADSGVELIDCTEMTLMPGLIDAHNHLSLDSKLDNYLERMADPIPALTIRAVKNLQEDLLAGVTTMRCLGDKGFLDIECRRAVEAGALIGPRLVLAGKGIRSSAGHGFVGYPFDGPDRIRRAVRENIAAGADIVKFYVTGTLPVGGGYPCFLSRKEIEVIVDEANRTGRKTAVHCIGGIGFDWCLDAGVDVIEHGYFLTERQIDRLKTSGTKLVLTPSFYMSEDRIYALPKHLIGPHLEAAPAAKASMKAVVDSGSLVGVGTDGVHGKGAMAREISFLQELGASPHVALSAATQKAAEICGLADLVGTIEEGKAADVIGIKTNPLDNTETLSDISCVISRGRLAKGSASKNFSLL